jgi:hypothetical protein
MTRARNTADTQTASGGPVPPNIAGKNAIINGDFRVNQRAFSSTTTNGIFMFDRWRSSASDGTSTFTAQTFTPGTAPVAGYEGTNFVRLQSTGQTSTSALTNLQQQIESSRTLAGQTATISFWAKANSGTPSIAVWLQQNFGTGGSSGIIVNGIKKAITTSWARYSYTINIPSVSGKTIDSSNDSLILNITTSAGTDRNSYTDSLGIQTNTFDIWGVQVEAGPVATPFQTATGTIQGELAACQRYYFRNVSGSIYGALASGQASATTGALTCLVHPVTMRIVPTVLDYASLGILGSTGSALTVTSASIGYAGFKSSWITANVASGLVAGNATLLTGANNVAAYIGLSAEL